MFSDKNIRREKKDYIYQFLQKLKKKRSVKYREKLNSKLHEKLKDVKFTIFCNNCLGGWIYHDAGMQFTSPTINLSFDGECFLKFLENPLHYKDYPMKFVKYDKYNFPIAHIDDIEVHFVHYKTEEEAVEKWKTRFDRIVWDNIFVIATNVDGMADDKLMERFDKIPYKNKIMFVSKEYPQYEWAVPVKECMGRFQVRIMSAFANFKGQKYHETNFDVAKWIRENSSKEFIK